MNLKIGLLAAFLFALLLVSGCNSLTSASQETTANQPTIPTIPTNTTPTTTAIREGSSIGNRAPDFELQTIDGQTVKLSAIRGKPVLLNFWATWCPPCRAEMPYLQQIQDSWSARGLVLLAVDIGESSAAVQEFVNELKLSLTVPMDADGKVADAYSITAIPTTFFLDVDGIIRQKIIGAFPDKGAIEKELGKIMP